MYLVDSSCREVPADRVGHSPPAEPRPLSGYRNLPAYVLIGDPGAGKTTAFEQECAALGDRGEMVSARDFLAFEDRPEWHGKTLFIDGLDEIRAGAQDVRTPFDAIRARLDKLGRPQFRLSCRGADWLGALDRDRLAMVAPGGNVQVLCLEPLAGADILQVLEHSPQVEDAAEFMREAERRRLSALLANPHTLGLLAEAVAAGAWPETRRETFELACRKLIGERNPEHQVVADMRPADLEQSLRAVGFLCAVQIIAGKAGYALMASATTEDFPWLRDLSGKDRELFATVVRSRLFKFSGSGLIIPIHRHLAEYLAARYLADRIERTNLPVGRILAAVTGVDGMVVSQLRGLSAWLAALCASRRDLIIARDPIGVALYGDIKDFPARSKSRLLEELGPHMPGHHSLFWSPPLPESPLGMLATPDMEDRFRQILLNTDRSDGQQEVVGCVLDAMQHGADFPEFRSVLLWIARDPTLREYLRKKSIKLLRHYRGIFGGAEELKTLAREIRDGRVTDPSGNLMGQLLFDLYPDTIPLSEILDYLYAPHRSGKFRGDVWRYNWYTMFWETLTHPKISAAELAPFLDRLSAIAEVFYPAMADLIPGWGARLVARGLQEYGEAISSERLHQWLKIVRGEHGMPAGKLAPSQIREWLDARPTIRAGVLDRYFDQYSKEEEFGANMTSASLLLFGEKSPLSFGRWCLEKLPEAESAEVLRYLVEQAVRCHEIHNVVLSWKNIEAVTKKNLKQSKLLSETLSSTKLVEERRCARVVRQKAKAEEQLKFVKSSETALRNGDAPLELLYVLGRVCLGQSEVEGSAPKERLERYLRQDQVLVDAAIVGLRYSLHASQIPSAEDIVQLYVDNKIHLLGPPVLAGLELAPKAATNGGLDLSDRQLRQACAFHLTGGENQAPAWYSALVKTRPELVAEVLQTCVGAILKSNKKGRRTLDASLHALAYDDSWTHVARMSAMGMLRAFPVRASKRQLAWLNMILHAALCHSSQTDFLALILGKAKLGSMNVGTRIRWLAAGTFARPEKFLQQLANFVNAAEMRVRHLADFCAAISTMQLFSTPTIELLFRQIGEFYAPHKDPSARPTLAEKASRFLCRLLSELESRPTKETTDVLARLSAEPKLEAWQYALQVATAKQQTVRREAEFRHLNVSQANQLLNNQQPANADDLKALTEAVIEEVSDWVRNGDTDDYRQYWNEGPRRELESPKHEEACRDALLSELRQHLARFGVVPEAHRADDARADAVVATGGAHGFEVPIEIKKNTSPDLWRAMHDQLIVKYARDPRAGGRGLYVVFWFGADQKQPSPPQGAWPRTADELEARLRDTLSAEEARKIAVHVVDVAAPEQAKSAAN